MPKEWLKLKYYLTSNKWWGNSPFYYYFSVGESSSKSIYYYSHTMKQIVSIGEKKCYYYINKIWTLEVRKTPPQDDWCVYPAYLVSINGSDEDFLYNGTNLYLEAKNKEETVKQLELHAKEAKQMQEDWKTEEEIEKHFEWKGTTFVDRVEYIIDSPDDFHALLTKAIQSIS